jgi:nickel/cobalt exporter
MSQALLLVVSSFWAGAVHAATPGHGKTIAAAYIVGARGRPVDAIILGIFVTLSHTTGIVVVGVLASLGSAWLVPQRIEAYIALALGVLVIGLSIWMLWAQRELLALAMGESPGPAPAVAAGVGSAAATPWPEHGQHHGHGHHRGHAHHHAHEPGHGHPAAHRHDHRHGHRHGAGDGHAGEDLGWHSHGWGTYHSHRLDLVTDRRPKLAMLLVLGVVGGILPDPAALAILLAALSTGQVVLGLVTVLVFSLGFATTLVIVGIIAAKVGQKVLDWLSGLWVARVQIATIMLIFGMGVVLTLRALGQVAALA